MRRGMGALDSCFRRNDGVAGVTDDVNFKEGQYVLVRMSFLSENIKALTGRRLRTLVSGWVSNRYAALGPGSALRQYPSESVRRDFHHHQHVAGQPPYYRTGLLPKGHSPFLSAVT